MARTDKIVTPYYKPEMVEVFKIIECISFVLLTIYVCLYIRLLLRKKFCHVNLLVLLCAQPIAHLLSMSSRMFKHAFVWTGLITPTQGQALLFWDNLAADVFVSTSFQILVGISVERIIAMTIINEYETKYKRPYLALVIIVICFSWSSVLLYCWNLDIVPNRLAYPLQYAFFGSATFGFIVLRFVSLYAYKKVANFRYASIEDRYLTAQNLKAAILLCYIAPFKGICNVLQLAAYHWIFEEHSPEYFPYYGNFYFLVNHVQLYIQIILTVCGHAQLKERLRKMLGRRDSEAEKTIRSVIGSRMVFSYEEENQIYHKQMQEMWRSVMPGDDEPARRAADKRKKYASIEPEV